MNSRERSMGRAATVTGVLAAVGIAGSLSVAAIAYSDNAKSGTTSDTSTVVDDSTGSGSTDSSDSSDSSDSGPWSGSSLSGGSGSAHARSGGS